MQCELGWVSLQVQCNVFEGTFKDVALTAVEGRRRLPFFKNTFEYVALVNLPTVTQVCTQDSLVDKSEQDIKRTIFIT
jgi:hypothetical protein